MKEQDNHSLDQLFRNLGETEINPPTATWGQMEALLDAQAGKKKRKVVLVWWAAAAALIPFVLFSLYWLQIGPKAVEVAQNKDVQSKIESTTPAPETKAIASLETNSKETKVMPQPKPPIARLEKPAFKKDAGHSSLNVIANPKAHPVTNEDQLALNAPTQTVKQEALPVQVEPITNTETVAQIPVIQNYDQEVASIEYKPGKLVDTEEDMVAVEVLPDRSTKSKLQNTWDKIKNTDPAQIPVVVQAREGLMALLHNKK